MMRAASRHVVTQPLHWWGALPLRAAKNACYDCEKASASGLGPRLHHEELVAHEAALHILRSVWSVTFRFHTLVSSARRVGRRQQNRQNFF